MKTGDIVTADMGSRLEIFRIAEIDESHVEPVIIDGQGTGYEKTLVRPAKLWEQRKYLQLQGELECKVACVSLPKGQGEHHWQPNGGR